MRMCLFGYDIQCIILCCVCLVSGFNINVETPTFISGVVSNGSYFGYTVALAQTSTDKWILIGSPRSYDPHMPSVQRPGAVYRCKIGSSGGPDCVLLNIDNKTGYDAVPYGDRKVSLIHGKDNAWLGGSIAVGSGSHSGFATCAPKWYNRQYADEYYMAGMCYEIPLDFNMDNVRKLPALVNGLQLISTVGDRNVFNYAYSGLGTSVHYAKVESSGMDHLLIGSSGLLDWIGGFVDIHGNDDRIMKNTITDTAITRPYIGFATTSGKYFSNGVVYFAFGAPRDEMIGMVVFFRSGDSEFVLQKPALILQGKDEDNEDLPPNSYFGATLYTVDVNNDVADDLLVGAPLYSPLTNDVFSGIIDLGLVAVYMGSRHSTSFQNPPRILKGVEPYGRFGTAIESLGDINGDLYNDVAIGAPYENNNKGAVYIFNGYTKGLWPAYSQRIQASELNTGLSGFGISISSGMDLNSDNINDVLVGSYLSDEVIMFFGQPVISLNGELNVVDKNLAKTDFVEVDERDKMIEICFKFSDRRCSHVELTITTTLDVHNLKYARVKFAENNRRYIIDTLMLFSDNLFCTPTYKFYAVPTIDYVSDIVITAEYEVKTIECPSYDVTATISRFNGNKPQDPRLILQKEMQFRKKCPNNICHTDLNLSVNADYVNSDGNFLIGNQDLTLDVTITKTGDPSYGSSFHLVYPSYLGYTKLEQVFGETHVTCSLLEQSTNETDEGIPMADDETGLNCLFGNPMSNDTGVGFKLHMRVPPILAIPYIMMRMVVKTMSIEQDSRDNKLDVIINMKYHVDAIFSGIATEDMVYIKDDSEKTFNIEHIYELDNRGPSSLVEAQMNISYPFYCVAGKSLMYLNSTETKCHGACDITCSVLNSNTPVHQYKNGRLVSVSGTHTEDMETVEKQNCLIETCPMVQCTIQNLQAYKNAVVYLQFVLKKELRKSLGDDKTMDFISQAMVRINEDNLISNRTYFDQQLTTTVKERTIIEVPFQWWIIVVSILVGLLLIAIMVLILWKVGFFKRKTRDQVREMRKSRPPAHGENTATMKRDSYTDSENGIIDSEHQPATSE